MAPRKTTAREPEVTELLAEEIAHLLMRADRVEPRDVTALVDQLRVGRKEGAARSRVSEDPT